MKPEHAPQHAFKALGITINLARQSTDAAGLQAIIKSPLGTQVQSFLRAVFGAQQVNPTESRAALHWVYRAVNNPELFESLPFEVSGTTEGRDELQAAGHEVARMEAFVDQVRSGGYTNPEGQPYTAIVHLGIGGSDLGPRLLDQVFNRLYLRQGQPPLDLRFIANLDYHEQQWALQGLDPSRTLVVIASKSFTTRETLLNAQGIRQWLDAAGPQYAGHAFVGATCKPEKAIEFGVDPARVFAFSEEVGGRYSLWGPVSIAIRMVYGNTVFRDFLNGAAEMDAHTLQTPLHENLPVLLATADHSNLNQGVDSLMLSPYDSRMDLLIPYLQQLWMESLGKGVNLQGEMLSQTPCPMLWGNVGTNGQHAFFQMLHQSPVRCAVELMAFAHPQHAEIEIHQALMSHFLAQAEAFAQGRLNSPQERLDPGVNFKTCLGHRPVTSMVIDTLSPRSLGALLALWEHRTEVLSAYRGVNPFDQWGVELGKTIAQTIEPALNSSVDLSTIELDPITNELIATLKNESGF